MTRHIIADLGPAPANEPCAQLGRTPNFEILNILELQAYQAAITALNPALPAGMSYAHHANHHDFGTYYTLVLETAPDTYPTELAHIVAERLHLPLTWISAGFRAPVDYSNPKAPVGMTFDACILSALEITRPRANGSFYPPENEHIHNRLRAAYPGYITAS
jgi:hypothetical protein